MATRRRRWLRATVSGYRGEPGALANGIAPDERTPVNAPYLYAVSNARCTANGVESIVVPTEKFDVSGLLDPAVCNPTPQLFYDRGLMMLFFDTVVAKVTPGATWIYSNDGGVSESLYKIYNPGTVEAAYPAAIGVGSETTIAATGGPWHFVSMGKAWAAVKVGCVLYYGAISSLRGGTDGIYKFTSNPMRTMCNFKGQIVYGGLTSGSYFPAGWETIIGAWWSKHSGSLAASGLTMPAIDALGNNWIGWGQAGGGDFLNWAMPYVAMKGLVAADPRNETDGWQLYLEWLKRNGAGMMPMPFGGNINGVFPLGDAVIIYGVNGLGRLRPIDSPLSPWAFDHIAVPGPADRGAFGGDGTVHCWVDAEDRLWRWVVGEAAPVKLDYGRLLGASTAVMHAVNYDPVEREFTITCWTYCEQAINLVLSPTGLSYGQQRRNMRSLLTYDGALYGIAQTNMTTGSDITDIVVVLWPVDGGSSGRKEVGWMQVHGTWPSATTAVYLGCDYRDSRSAAWSIGSWVPATTDGRAFVGVGGVELRPKVKLVGHAWGSIQLTELSAEVELVDTDG